MKTVKDALASIVRFVSPLQGERNKSKAIFMSTIPESLHVKYKLMSDVIASSVLTAWDVLNIEDDYQKLPKEEQYRIYLDLLTKSTDRALKEIKKMDEEFPYVGL